MEIEQKETVQGEDINEERAQLEAALVDLKEGQVVVGTVAKVSDDGVYVNIGYKSEGFIPLSELSYRSNVAAKEVAKVGDEIKVVVLSLEGHDGSPKLSKRKADEAEAWEKLKDQLTEGAILEGQVVEAVKGGLVVDLGLRAFLPASQVDRGYVSDLAKYVGQSVRVKVIELERQKNRVILSRKQVLESERDRSKAEFWQNVEEGQVRTGTVKSLTDFGAFVDLGGVDGLLHVSEMSYGRIKHPSQVLSDGETIQVKVLRLDREKGKVSLGLKQVLPDPWETAGEKYAEGSIVTGTVARLATFGAFVELEPGIDGLIHISQLSDRRVANPGEVVSVGDEVRAKVTQVKPEDRRISLSLRDVDTAPAEAGEAANYQSGDADATIGDALKQGEEA